MTNYRVLVVLVMAALLFGCSSRQPVEDKTPPQWGPSRGGQLVTPADEAREVVPFHKERVESLRKLNGEDRDEDGEFVPLDTTDQHFELNKAGRENRPGTVENQIVTLIQKTNDERAKIEEIADNGTDPTIMAKLRAHLEIGFNAAAAAGKLCETHGITYYPEIHRLQGEFLVALLLADEILKKDHPTEYTQIDSIKVTRKEATENLSDWYPAYEVFGLEYVSFEETESKNDNLTVAVRFRSTPYATTMYITYLEAREDIERVEWTTMELFKNPLISPDEGESEPDDGDHADDHADDGDHADDHADGDHADEEHPLCPPPLHEPGAEEDGNHCPPLPEENTANRLIEEALKLPEPPENAREKILPAEAAEIRKGQFPPAIIFAEGGAERVDIHTMLQVLAVEARLVRAEDNEAPITIEHPLFVSLNLLNSDEVFSRLTEQEKLTTAALSIVLVSDVRVIDADWYKPTVNSMAVRVLSKLADRNFGYILDIYPNSEEAEKQMRHNERVQRDWHRWWSVAADTPMADWSTVELPPIPDGVETDLDAQEREEERIETEKRAKEQRLYEVYFKVSRILSEASGELLETAEPDMDAVEQLVTEAQEVLELLSALIQKAPDDSDWKTDPPYVYREFDELKKLIEAFKSPAEKLSDVATPDDLLGMKLHVPEEILTQPGDIWDLHLEMMKDYGMADPETGEEVKGEAVIPLFKAEYGERPEDIPAPTDNATRITSEQLREFAHEHLKATDGVRIWWPGTAGTMDYLENRLNIHVNKFGRVTSVNWG